MAASFVALDIALPGPGRLEIAAVVEAPESVRRLLYLQGADPLAARARRHGQPGIEIVEVTSLADVARALLELADQAPWVTYDQASRLEAWHEQDTTGALETVPQPDVGDLAALALPHVSGRAIQGFLTEALALVETGAPPAVEPERGLAFAEAVAALWRLLPGVIAQRPYAIRREIADLLDRSGMAIAPAWRQAAGGPRSETEPEILDALLRQRLRDITPPQVAPEEPPKPRPIATQRIEALFAEDGPLAQAMGRWEPRPGQLQMAVAVAEALNGGQCLLVEAGTGTGKSLAYLAPAVLFALQNETPVVVSTATKNLQDQLCAKDLPLLRAAIEEPFRAELIKGRGNYLCADKLLREYLDAGWLPLDDQILHLAYLLSWASVTPSGDLDELSGYLLTRYPKLYAFAARLASDGESCTSNQARNHPCFATLARRRAGEANVLVVNHALALANTAVEVLPPFRHIIFDEAHNLEDIATEAFGLTVERRELLALARDSGASRDTRALHHRVRRVLSGATGELVDSALSEITGLEQAASSLVEGIEHFGEGLGGLVMNRLRRTMEEMTQTERLRIDPTFWQGALGELAKVAGENVLQRALAVLAGMTNLLRRLQDVRGAAGFLPDLPTDEIDRLLQACQAAQNQWSEQARAIMALLELADEHYVYWLEFVLRREAWEWRLRAAPIEPGRDLADKVYLPMDAVVLTSATLSVDRSFDYFGNRLGLSLPSVGERYRALAVPSPFRYKEQVLLALPTNIVQPKDPEYDQQVAKAVRDLAEILNGRTLALFTSVRSMKAVYERIASRLEEEGIEVLCQGVSGSRHLLAERFRTHERAVLLGTRSFWEGIDVPGEALSCVVITRLPFSVPKDPVFEARCEQLEARGVNAWSQYAVPQAVILFKQGFGRLIRASSDRGVVVCLDRRLNEMGYGRAFLRSVPGYTSVFDRWSEVRERVREWLE